MATSTLLAVIFGVGWGICEALAAIPSVQSNSVFQAIFSMFKTLSGKK